MYSFNSYGWLSAEPIAGRETSVEPPAHGDKEVGQPYPNFTGVEWVLVDYSEPVIPVPPQIYALDLSLTCTTPQQGINTAFDVTAILSVHGTTQVAPITDTFAVPIMDSLGAIVMVKAVSFVDGVANPQITFPKSGYYVITNDGINVKLPDGSKIFLAQPFELVAYE